MKIFISGLSGFVGEHISKTLVRRGHEVTGLVRYSSTRDYYTLNEMLPNVRWYLGDLMDVRSLEKALADAKPEVILNLAAQTSCEYSFQHPEEVYQTNFIGTMNVASVAKRLLPNLRKFVHASSVEVYGNQQTLPLVETMHPRPASPYGVAKLAAEGFLMYLHDGYKFPALLVRNANSYGRDRNRNFVVEHIIQELLSDLPHARMGEKTSERDFYYIDDEEEMYVKTMESDVVGEIFNTGTGRPISIEALYHKVEDIMGIRKDPLWYTISPRPFEIRSLTMDIRKAKALLDWEPRTSLDEGLRRTAEYWVKRRSTS